MKSFRFGWIFRFFVFLIVLILIQDIVIILSEHHQFAASVVCSDPKLKDFAGRYLTVHCIEHAALGDWTRLSSWVSATTDISWQRLIAATGALVLALS